MTDYEKEFETFWAEIVMPDGVLNLDQVKRELADYSYMLSQVPRVYCEVTGNTLSYPNYPAETIIAAFRDQRQKDVDEAIEDFKKYDDNDDGILRSLMILLGGNKDVLSTHGEIHDAVSKYFRTHKYVICPECENTPKVHCKICNRTNPLMGPAVPPRKPIDKEFS